MLAKLGETRHPSSPICSGKKDKMREGVTSRKSDLHALDESIHQEGVLGEGFM